MKKVISITAVLIIFSLCFAGAKNSENKVNHTNERIDLEASGESIKEDDDTGTMRKVTQEELDELKINCKESIPKEMEIDENNIEINNESTFMEFN